MKHGFGLKTVLGSAIIVIAMSCDDTAQQGVEEHGFELTCTTAVARFQQGNSYSGALDTHIYGGWFNSNSSYENDPEIRVDNNWLNFDAQGLVRFENIFGSGADQVPMNKEITNAELVLYGTNQTKGDVSVHQMLVSWPVTSTWNSMNNGIAADDSEAVSSPEDLLSSPSAGAYHTIDVTTSVTEFQVDPASNFGWVLMTTSSDSWRFASAENGNPDQRPELIIEYCTEPDPCDGVVCDTPPADLCLDTDTARFYNNPGTCTDGMCNYGFSDTVCAFGCIDGACNPGTSVDCTLNPYQAVDWATWGQYKANFHTHTTNSDGYESPTAVIDEYHSAGYEVLAITDHNFITWPWTDYGRDPTSLGMLAVRGDEYSNSDHVNAFFDFTASSQGLENGIPHVEASSGLSHINHPGRYSSPSDWGWYIPWYRDYPSCVGLEVFNQGDRYSDDRRLWDNINDHYFQSDGKLVWGYSNDDKHTTGHLYRNYQFMLMSELTQNALQTSQWSGAFYFCYEPGGSGTANVPRIHDIAVDKTAKTITITASGYNTIFWIGPGTSVVATGPIFNYTDYLHTSFVRAVLAGTGGDSFTQPFGFVTTTWP